MHISQSKRIKWMLRFPADICKFVFVCVPQPRVRLRGACWRRLRSHCGMCAFLRRTRAISSRALSDKRNLCAVSISVADDVNDVARRRRCWFRQLAITMLWNGKQINRVRTPESQFLCMCANLRLLLMVLYYWLCCLSGNERQHTYAP